VECERAESSVDVGPVSNRQDFQAIFDVSENDPVLANAQPITAGPFAAHWFNVSRMGFAEVSDAFENVAPQPDQWHATACGLPL
jgi:hypothetical protein